jgi:transcriptional regulator GlxA family with amidase domain
MDKRILKAIALMESQHHSNLSLEEVARSVNLSLSRLGHLFKIEIGTPPAQYLKSLRLEHAKELLETSLLNIKQIISIVGIKDKSNFTREFKRAYGLTPTQYRVTHLNARRGGSGLHS